MSLTENRATVHNERLEAAFSQGLAEGVEHRGDEEEFIVRCLFEGTVLSLNTFGPEALGQALQHAAEHLRSATGASVSVERRWKAPAAATKTAVAAGDESDDEVVDAEIVDT